MITKTLLVVSTATNTVYIRLPYVKTFSNVMFQETVKGITDLGARYKNSRRVSALLRTKGLC